MATKKFFSREIKIALAFIVALTILVVGINFLKGINVFTPTNYYYLKFERVDGLVVSNGVFIKGYKIGQVRDIQYDFTDKETPFTVEFAINEDISIPKGTVAYLFDESLMGGKGINIVLGDMADAHVSGDTLTSDIEVGLLANVAEIVPQIQTTISRIDTLLVSANTLIGSEDIQTSLKNINLITANLNTTSRNLNRVVANQIPSFLKKADSIAADINVLTAELKGIKFKDIALQVDTTLTNLNTFTKKLNSPNSSLGLLMNDKRLYQNLEQTANSANMLLIDLKENPKRYVHFSIWGRKEKKDKDEKDKGTSKNSPNKKTMTK